jgi:hypothetical protein
VQSRDISSAQRRAAVRHGGAQASVPLLSTELEEDGMGLLVAFIALAVVGQVLNVMICLGLERFYPAAKVTVPVFFILWVAVFWTAWKVAVRLTEPREGVVLSPDQQRVLAFLTTAAHAPMIV